MSWDEFCKINEVSDRFRKASFSEFDHYMRDVARTWLSRPGMLVISGDVGTGKTRFSYALTKAVIEKYGLPHVRWIKSKTLDDKIIAALNLDGDSSYILESICDIPFLFLDDFGVDRATERAERDYYQIIDERWENRRPTVITTNLTHEEIAKHYGARIYSRLKTAQWATTEGKDRREGEAMSLQKQHNQGQAKHQIFDFANLA